MHKRSRLMILALGLAFIAILLSSFKEFMIAGIIFIIIAVIGIIGLIRKNW